MAKKSRSPRPNQPIRHGENATEWVDRFLAGSEDAATLIFARYMNRLTALARTRLSPRLTSRFDADDVVMSAYRSFFIGLRERSFVIASENDLWQLLAQITLRKLYGQVTRHQSKKRSAYRDVVLELSDGTLLPIPSRDPEPNEVAIAVDELEHLLVQLSIAARRAVELRLQGETLTAIAAELRVHERTVRRWLSDARQILLARQQVARCEPSGVLRKPDRVEAIRVASSQSKLEPGESTRRRTSEPRQKVSASCARLPNVFTLNYSDFVLLHMIGSGTSGKVYKAKRLSDSQYFAIKFLRKALVQQSGHLERFLTEFEFIQQLNHPHILPVLGCGQTGQGSTFFAMHLAESDVQQAMSRRSVPIARAIDWLLQAGKGLVHSHRKGIVHCDLKPANLLLTTSKTIWVSDFGLAHRQAELTNRDCLAGTPAFMAPEQVNPAWGAIDQRTDVYGLGATLFAMLTGRAPFVGTRVPDVLSQVASAIMPPEPTELRRTIPAQLARICMRCLQKEPAQRFPSVTVLLQEINRSL